MSPIRSFLKGFGYAFFVFLTLPILLVQMIADLFG